MGAGSALGSARCLAGRTHKEHLGHWYTRHKGGGQGLCAPANIEKKLEKKAHHETWKARWCGREALKMMNCVALCSASTGTANSRPKMSLVPRELTPFFSSAVCSLFTCFSSS